MIDCTVEGLLHAPELGAILGGGARVLMVSNEHPENFERYAEDTTLADRVARGVALLEAAAEMQRDLGRRHRSAGAARRGVPGRDRPA